MAEAKAKAKEGVSEAPKVPIEETSDNAARSTTHVVVDGEGGNAVLSEEIRGLPQED